MTMTDRPDALIPVPRGPLPVLPPEPEARMLAISINGQPVVVPEGDTILQACRQIGIDIPTLCFLESLTPVNVCRICVVELEGSRVLVPACSRKVEDGMVIHTHSDRVKLSRRLVLEFLASSVDVSTAPQLQSYMTEYGAQPERFGPHAATVAQPVKIDNPLYTRDYAKCILCYKCVQACGREAQNTYAIAVSGRGFEAHISTEYDAALPDSACVYCGNCIAVCPTGALMPKAEHDLRAADRYDESCQTQTDTICAYCGVGCTVTLHVQDNRVFRVTSPLDNSITGGNLCIKGRFGYQYTETKSHQSE
jgi:predicted molibdopterin-dependent oxidoreductase YjgC